MKKSPGAGEEEGTRKLRILLVDDEEGPRETIAMLLELENTVTQASSGAEALGIAALEPPDLVITDYRMEGMRGDELAARLKADCPGIKVIMLTGYTPSQEGNPVDLILYKPCGLEELRSGIKKVLST